MKETGWFGKMRMMLSKMMQQRVRRRAVQMQQKALDALYARAGREMYEIYERTHACEPVMVPLFAEIRRRQDALEDLRIDAEAKGAPRIHCTPMHTRADAAASVGDVRRCPRCGAVCLRNAERCAGCGFVLRRGA